MTVRNTFFGNTPWADGDILFAGDLNDTTSNNITRPYADNDAASTASSTTEVDLTTLTIPSGDLNATASLSIFTGIKFENDGSGGAGDKTGTFRIYVDDVLKSTHILTGDQDEDQGTAMTHLEPGVDVAGGNIIVKVTGQNSVSGAGVISTSISLSVIGQNMV